MATAAEIREAVHIAVIQALKDEPTDKGMRARLFVAGLQGCLGSIDAEIAADLELLRYPDGRPVDELTGGDHGAHRT